MSVCVQCKHTMVIEQQHTSGDGDGGGGGVAVVVAVKMEEQSRELMSWALVNVAKPGDRVIVLHVIINNNDSTPQTPQRISSSIRLMNNFNSMLSPYQRLCNSKQVDLKLKVCRGSSVKKCIVEEAKSYLEAVVIVGSSRNNFMICSQLSVAKYCARKLPRNFLIYAVDNGKVVYQKEADATKGENFKDFCQRLDDIPQRIYVCLFHQQSCNNTKESGGANDLIEDALDRDSQHSFRKSCLNCNKEIQNNIYKACSSAAVPSVNSNSKEFASVNSSLTLVTSEEPESLLSSVHTSPNSRNRSIHLFQPSMSNSQCSKKSSFRRLSSLGLSGSHSFAMVHPDQEQFYSDQDDRSGSDLDYYNRSIIPYFPETPSTCSSAYNSCKSVPKELEGLHEKYSSTCSLFSYEELLSATNNFAPENMVGKGGSSYVYRGCLSDGKELAVKILKYSDKVVKEFITEIEIITALHHENIISFSGFCYEDNNLLLVYDYLSRGSLEENLHGNKKNENAFKWHERQKVAVGIAEALEYLHNKCAEPVIHKDVKSPNILLSDNFEPKLSDFGLANWASAASSYINYEDVAGTFGYLAPEYLMHGTVSNKIDIYAFGVVLLELLSGRKPIDSEQPEGQESLVMWARKILKDGQVSQLLDPSLASDQHDNQVERMALAASLCIRVSPRCRPQINLVLKLLQGDKEVMKWARQQVQTLNEVDAIDEEGPANNLESHLNVALQDLVDDSFSISSSTKPSNSIRDYLQRSRSHLSSCK